MSTRDEDRKWSEAKGLTVGRINFETRWSKEYSWPSLSSEAQLQALAIGLNQLTGVIQTILDKVDGLETTLTLIQKQLDKQASYRWKNTNQ
jgi:hypothetical protein